MAKAVAKTTGKPARGPHRAVGARLGKGAEADVFACRFLGKPAVCKTRNKKAYRHPVLDAKLRLERTCTEARLLARAKATGTACPLVRHVDEQKKELVVSRAPGRLLARALNAMPRPRQNAVLRDAGRQLARLHAAGVAHGDYTTSNVMTDGSRAVVIDFGLAEFTNALEDHATDVLLFKKSVSPVHFRAFWGGYARENPRAKAVLRQLADIERRGRYVVRAMAG